MSPFPIDPGTVPAAAGPGVVAGGYALEPSSLVEGGWFITAWNTRREAVVVVDGQEHQANAGVWVRPNGLVICHGYHAPTPALRIALDRLRRHLGEVVDHPERYPPLTEQTLRTWLRELNLHEMETP